MSIPTIDFFDFSQAEITPLLRVASASPRIDRPAYAGLSRRVLQSLRNSSGWDCHCGEPMVYEYTN
jgi:hypothetical protein